MDPLLEKARGLELDVYDKGISAAAGKQRSEIQRGSRLSHAALLIEHRNLGHRLLRDRKISPGIMGLARRIVIFV